MIYLVRHGETAWNRERRIQGHLDSDLTARGRSQARRMGRTLSALVGHRNSFAMVASPLGRVRQTASIICETFGRDAHAYATDDRLKEITWGDWDGLTLDEIEARDPGELARRRRNLWRYVPPGGESYRMVASRAKDWLGEITPERCLVVVAHGALGRVLRGLYANLSIPETLAQDEPQDAVFRLHCGAVERIEVGSTD